MTNRIRQSQRIVAVVLSAALVTTGCATAGGARVITAPVQEQDRVVLVEYVQKLTPGSSVRVERSSGTSVRGTLIKATDTAVILQQRTRVPEPAIEIPMTDVLAVIPDAGNGFSLAKAIGAGAAAGAGAALAVFLVLVAIYD